MKKILYSAITGPDYSRHTGEIMEAEYSDEWNGDVAAYLANLDGIVDYIEGAEHIPGDVQQHFTKDPSNICVELDEAGNAITVWWAQEEE